MPIQPKILDHPAFARARRKSVPSEEVLIRRTVRKMMSQQAKKVEAVCDISLSFGKGETDEFAKKSIDAQHKGLAFHRRCQKEIGRHHQIVIWMQFGTTQNNFITDLQIGHTFHRHALFIDGRDLGFEPILHERMKGSHRDEPTVCFWCKTDVRAPAAIDDVSVSYCRKDESELRKNGYEMLPNNLENFGLATARLWIHRIDRNAIKKPVDTGKMVQELESYRNMLSQTPNDDILRSMVSKAKRKLRAAQSEEDFRHNCIPMDPLMYTKEFLALDLADVNKFKVVFERLGPDCNETISTVDFVRSLEEKETMVPFLHHIFALSGSKEIVEYRSKTIMEVDFGTTIRCVAFFCMLGVEEILQATFSFCNSKGQASGKIANGDFLSILDTFHPQCKGRMNRVLRELDLPEEGKLSFGTFKQVHTTFPHLMFPAFRIQETMQKHFMGSKWWHRKNRKFQAAKEAIRRENDEFEAG